MSVTASEIPFENEPSQSGEAVKLPMPQFKAIKEKVKAKIEISDFTERLFTAGTTEQRRKLVELESIVKMSFKANYEAGGALFAIQKDKLYELRGCESFAEYCEKAFEYTPWTSAGNYNKKNWTYPTEFVSRQDIIRKLIAKGASPNDSKSLLNCGSLDDVKLLMEGQEKLNWDVTNSNFGETFLHILIRDVGERIKSDEDEKERNKMIELALSQGASVNIKNHNGLTPIFYCKDFEILSMLLKSPTASRLKPDDYGTRKSNPLQYWVESLEATELLLKHKASPNIKNEDGKIPLAYLGVENPNWYKIVELHKQYGLRMDAETQTLLEGKTTAHQALVDKEKNNIEVIVQKIKDSENAESKYGQIWNLHYRLEEGIYSDYPEQKKYLAELEQQYSEGLKIFRIKTDKEWEEKRKIETARVTPVATASASCSWGCNGKGRLESGMRCPDHSDRELCSNCGGSGVLKRVVMPTEGELIESAFGGKEATATQIQRTCPTCKGIGYESRNVHVISR